METDFLEGDGVTWVGFLVLLAMLRSPDANIARTARA